MSVWLSWVTTSPCIACFCLPFGTPVICQENVLRVATGPRILRRPVEEILTQPSIWSQSEQGSRQLELRMSRKEVFVVVTHWVLGCFLLRHYCAISWHIISDHFCFPFQSSFNCTYIHFYKFDLCIMFSKEIQSHSEKKVWSYLFILGLLIYPPVRIKKKWFQIQIILGTTQDPMLN